MPIARELALDEGGDLLINTKGDIVLLDGPDALAQRIQSHLRTIRGEWVHDQRIGVPWLQDIMERGASLAMTQQILRQAILEVPGVESILLLTIQVNEATRAATVSGVVQPEIGDPVNLPPIEVGG